jgi:hypothetical protein
MQKLSEFGLKFQETLSVVYIVVFSGEYRQIVKVLKKFELFEVRYFIRRCHRQRGVDLSKFKIWVAPRMIDKIRTRV